MTGMEQQLKEEILDTLYWDNRVNASNINVEVKETEAILSGSVFSHTAGRAAEADALNTYGIHSVKNALTIQYQVPSEPSDSAIQSMVHKICLWNTVIDESKIHLEVDKGIVTLKGTVSSLWEKVRAEDLVDDIIGVVGVINELAVVPLESYRDELIAKRITHALEKSVSIEIDSVNVKVEHGRVTLSGSVRSNFARDRAADIAVGTAGVILVENLITVKPTS